MFRATCLSIAPLAFAALFCSASNGHARSTTELATSRASSSDLPARAPLAGSRADTICFGYVQTIGGALYAVPGESWTFDHGGGGTEGWYAVDMTADSGTYFRRIDVGSWSGHGNGVAAPIVAGQGSAWLGAFEDEADALCWESGLGYGNRWCQRWESPMLTYTGSGSVTLDFDYFNDTELGYDFTAVRLRLGNEPSGPLLLPEFSGQIGNPGTASYAHLNHTIDQAEFLGETTYRLQFEFTSDGGWSDEDGGYATSYGAFGLDDVALSGPGVASPVSYDYESGAQGWAGAQCPTIGSFFGVADLADYTLLDACSCRLSGNVMELHQGIGDNGTHPTGQWVRIYSPPADRGSLGPSYNKIIGSWDLYEDLPRANGVFIRAGWNYYPYICPSTGQAQWSGRTGNNQTFFWEDDPGCYKQSGVATDEGIPRDVQLISLVLEVYSSCDAFLVPPTVCTGVTNFSPLYDNVRICVTNEVDAPAIAFAPGGQFQDGFGFASYLSTTSPGNANCAYDLHRDTPAPDLLGDSLVIRGPVVTSSTKWEARMWWRLPRIGPGQNAMSGYAVWRNAVSDGLNIVGPAAQFAFGWMDSSETNTQTAKNAFISEFRENDDDFVGENGNNNEMIRDGILAPGTQVQYFLTANYTCTPSQLSFLPDTAGGNFLEFEILPSWRLDAGAPKYPCILTVDLNTGEQSAVERALNVVLNGAAPSDPVPSLRPWDRYDYEDATSNWNAPLARSVGGNNGLPLIQLMGYRQIILYTGGVGVPAMVSADFALFSDWLSNMACDPNTLRQGWIGAGDNLARIVEDAGPNFAMNYLGLHTLCDAYHAAGCGPSGPADQSTCVRIDAASGSFYAPLIDVDVTGNWCPQLRAFDVLSAAGGGVGNRVYRDYDRVPPTDTNYAQIARSVTGSGSDNYRAVVSGFSFGSLSTRDAGLECATDPGHNVPAIAEELRAALRWTYNGDANVPRACNLTFCEAGVDDDPIRGTVGVTRLFENRPNPFNPRTTLRFSLATAGRADLAIYDVSGRRVRTLVDANLAAGEHTEVWDGSDDAGHRVAAGIYWSQLRAGGFESQKKMVVLR